MISNLQSGTRVDEVAAGIYRICTPLDVIPGGFTFNSYLIVDDEPLLFHTGLRKLFPITLEAVGKVIPAEKLRWIGGSHFESDEFGALNDFLLAAPAATPFGSEIGVLTSLDDFAARPARGLKNGESLSLGSRRMRWFDTPHVPHGWDCGVLFDESTETLLCGDLFSSRAGIRRLSPNPRSLRRVKACAECWTITRMRLKRRRFSSGWRVCALRCSPASTGALIAATEQR